MDRKPQQSTYDKNRERAPLSTIDRHLLDEQCEGDIWWEERMKKLNPNWRLSENSLWDAYHE